MKVIPTLLLLGSLGPRFADDLNSADGPTPDALQADAKARLYVASIRDAVRDIKITNKEGTKLSGVQATQIDTGMVVLSGWKTVQAQRAVHDKNAHAQNQYASDVNVQIATHNGRCKNSVSQETYDWCEQDRARLAPLADKVDKWKITIDQSKDLVNSNIASMQKTTDDYNAESIAIENAGKAYLDRYKLIVRRVTDFGEHLRRLQVSYDVCKDALISREPGMTLEKLHDTCGSMFDGNIVERTTVEYPVPDPTFKSYDAPDVCVGDVCLTPVQ